LSLLFRLSNQNFICISHLLHVQYMPHPIYKHIQWALDIYKLHNPLFLISVVFYLTPLFPYPSLVLVSVIMLPPA
jgi:hypothetical protein